MGRPREDNVGIEGQDVCFVRGGQSSSASRQGLLESVTTFELALLVQKFSGSKFVFREDTLAIQEE